MEKSYGLFAVKQAHCNCVGVGVKVFVGVGVGVFVFVGVGVGVFVFVGVGVGVCPHPPCKIVTVEYWYTNEPLHAQNVGFEVLPGRVNDCFTPLQSIHLSLSLFGVLLVTRY
jgi:hypothetical protein